MTFEALPSSTRLGRYTALAALAGAATAANADIIVNSSWNGTVVGNGTPANDVQFAIPGLGGGFTIATRAFEAPNVSNYGVGTSGDYGGFIGVDVVWYGVGTGMVRRGGAGANPAFLASYGATQGAGTNAAAFGNINLAQRNTGSNFNEGNAGFSGTSKYLLFNFQSSGETMYGWIELLASSTPTGPGAGFYSVTLGDWAYDDSGVAITAGQTSNTPAVPGPAGLVALAMGAAGVRRKRSR